eukprot:g10348.t1
MNDDSSIVVVEHNTAPARNVARPLPPPPPLEQVARAEDTPVVPRNRNRTPTGSSARRMQFVDSKHVPLPKPKAPRDIDGDVDARNIVVGKRGRRHTPEGTATHSYRLVIAEDDEAQFAPQTDSSDGIRDTRMSVCLQGYLESQKKQLRVIPQVIEARKKDSGANITTQSASSGNMAGCRKNKVKPIRTGYLQSTVDACVFYMKGGDETFPPMMAYDTRRSNITWGSKGSGI